MRENRQSGSEGGGTKPIASPYPYFSFVRSRGLKTHFLGKALITLFCIDLPSPREGQFIRRTPDSAGLASSESVL
jgi:hypothetical protein